MNYLIDNKVTHKKQLVKLGLLRCITSKNLVFLCIGSDRVTGDCLGPLIGHMLTNSYNISHFVYGGLSRPITALNLTRTLQFIQRQHPLSHIVAIDSSVGRIGDVGNIIVSNGGIRPGSADGKNLPLVGDVSITATVTDTSPLLTMLTSSVRLGKVYELADTIAAAIHEACAHISSYPNPPADCPISARVLATC